MSLKANPNYQYAYGRTPLYCLINQTIIDETSCGFWMALEGDISAPEFIPVGCSHSRDINGSRVFKNFVSRGWTLDEEQQRAKLAKELIDELITEILAEAA